MRNASHQTFSIQYHSLTKSNLKQSRKKKKTGQNKTNRSTNGDTNKATETKEVTTKDLFLYIFLGATTLILKGLLLNGDGNTNEDKIELEPLVNSNHEQELTIKPDSENKDKYDNTMVTNMKDQGPLSRKEIICAAKQMLFRY